MGLIVQKFGGTSVANLERIKNVAKRVANTRDAGNQLVVVVSAMAGETDRLLALAKEVNPEPSERETDVLVSTGEQVTSALLAIALQVMGYEAVSLLGHQVRIFTDNNYSTARIQSVDRSRLDKELREGKIVVVAGFQGIDEDGNITTLGRGGSDLTAVAIAAVLNADLCEIYTDVEGVYTTDPSICPEARKIRRISYEEMLEMASLGAKVLQTRSVEFAKKYNVPIHVRSSFSDEEGTMVIQEERDMERVVVSGITYRTDEGKITIKGVRDVPGVAAQIFGPLADANIVVDMIIQDVSDEGLTNVTFTVPKGDMPKALTLVKKVAKDLKARGVSFDEDIAKVSIVGVGMRTHSGVAAKMFSSLAKEGINIQMISTSEIKISCVIEAKYKELAIRVLHKAFGLSEGDVRQAPPLVRRRGRRR
ncbi:MAG: aspartate kinase [Thermodesulfobacteriota bacterium]